MAYSMAVLLGRAIPDMYDGLKPAQRRVLQTMYEEGLSPEKRYVKCARVTGLTMGYYHPHGDCYGTLVNMATPWNNNVPWVDGHGNFGSTVDGPAAARYTECKLRPSAVSLLLQNSRQWEVRPNYDGSRNEAVRFNTAVPSVLLNGDSGIAVGFATKLAPHNLRELVEACKLANSSTRGKVKIEDAYQKLVPDFPTGCDIVNDEGLRNYIRSGSGSIRLRARMEVTESEKVRGKTKNRITFTNLPPGANPEKLGEQIKDALEKGKLDGISEILDESDLSGDRLTVVTKPGVEVGNLSRQLYAYSDLDTNYSAKTLVIDGVKPVELSPFEVCQKWFQWRMGLLERVFVAERDSVEVRLEVVTGLLKAISKIDQVIRLIRESESKKEALVKLVDRPLKFTRGQAEAILDMRLYQLTTLDGADLEEEQEGLKKRLSELETLIQIPEERAKHIQAQMAELAKRHGEARRSSLVDPPAQAATPSRSPGAKPPTGAPKPRFVKVDFRKGVVEQVKGPRGALVVENKEKLICLTEAGLLRKVPATFKGPIATSFGPLTLVKKESEVSQRKYLSVFELEGSLKAVVLDGSDLCKCTSKGKSWLPEGAKLVHFGENSFTVPWSSSRKRKLELTLSTVKAGKPGSKGIKIAELKDVEPGG